MIDFARAMDRVHHAIAKIKPHESPEQLRDAGVRVATGGSSMHSPQHSASADASGEPAGLRVRPTMTARAFAVGGGLLMSVAGVAIGGLLLVLRHVFSATEDSVLGEGFVSLVGPVVLGAVALLGLLILVTGLRARIELTAGGELSVRSVPPWRLRTVDCSELVALSGRRSSANPRGVAGGPSRPPPVPVALVDLRDAGGREVHLNLQTWGEPGRLGPELLDWARQSGVPVDAATREVLDAGGR